MTRRTRIFERLVFLAIFIGIAVWLWRTSPVPPCPEYWCGERSGLEAPK